MLNEIEIGPDSAVDVQSQSKAAPLALVNLLNDLDTLSDLLLEEINRESWLDAFLLAAGLNQIAEDALHEGSISLNRVARHVARVMPRPIGSVAAAAIQSADATLWALRSLPTSDRSLARWQRRTAALVDQLAAATVSSAATQPANNAALAATLLEDGKRLSAAQRRSLIRLPSCFRNFDQDPDDLEVLTNRFSLQWPDRARPIVVIGIRTSGSYTAPLHGAMLRARGFRDVRVLTFRPGQRWRPGDVQALSAVVRADGLALLTDDAPKSGRSVARVALALEAVGFAQWSIVLLLQMLEGMGSLPASLQSYPSVVLPWNEWAVQARLEPAAVRQTLSDLLRGTVEVRAVERMALSERASGRAHVRALYRVTMRDAFSSGWDQREVYVKGVGLGYLGMHALAVARPMKAFLPDVFGIADGLLYRQWLPDESRLATGRPDGEDAVAAAVVDYATARARALATPKDMSLRLVDRGAVWQRASDILSRAFGPAGQFVRPLSHPLARGLLRVRRPSVIDGAMQASTWFEPDISGVRLQKVDFDERAFCSLDIYCYDHIFDLAGAAGASPSRALRLAYERRTGNRIDPERWLLYRLVHVAEQARDSATQNVEVERSFAREIQDYYEDTVFAGVSVDASGPICAIDLDWVLETRGLGFPSITPAGSLALYALARHGYRVVVATGRSLDEVRERCRAYKLDGGVAEYGAVVYERRTGRVRNLLTPEDRMALDGLRSCLQGAGPIVLDPAYQSAIRAYRFDEHGRRLGLDSHTIETVLAASGLRESIRAIRGVFQTDFMVKNINKGVGLRVLARDLDQQGPAADGKVLALAIGDSAEDLPMLDLARLAVAPANADSAVKSASVRVLSRPGPACLAQAVDSLIGHRPGGCARCEVRHLKPRTRLLLTALAAQDATRLGKVLQAFRLAAALANTNL